ncbi:MAG: hypothetical protein J6V44_09605 [Methanobrevibacter sp.]|nr:hypothetical protein [Methanobrevibacter sp.]
MYEVKVIEASRQLSKKEEFKATDFTGNLKLDKELSEGNEIKIDVDYYVKCSVTNDDDESYEVIVVVDKDGKRYSTGSNSFMNSFARIAEVMEGEDFSVIAFKRESKKSGKTYICCTLE